MKKYIVAVSGGVDSVVLLDMLAKLPDLELVVAHFDHGIRNDSAKDAEFVAGLANEYNLKFESKREELGAQASEDLARTRRYKFLRELAGKHHALVATAHHEDDVIETIALNLIRGTGWRGLAVLDSDIWRPLTNMTKAEIIQYAEQHDLKWREDSTNVSDKYLRNRIRKQTIKLDEDTKRQILALWLHQKHLKHLIDEEAARLTGNGPTYDRYFFAHIDQKSGLECVRVITGARLTRLQQKKVLHAIKTLLPGKVFQAGGGVNVHFTARNFTVELLK